MHNSETSYNSHRNALHSSYKVATQAEEMKDSQAQTPVKLVKSVEHIRSGQRFRTPLKSRLEPKLGQ